MSAPGFEADEVLRLAASLDQRSEHPLAETAVRAAREQVAGRQLALGNSILMQQIGVPVGQ